MDALDLLREAGALLDASRDDAGATTVVARLLIPDCADLCVVDLADGSSRRRILYRPIDGRARVAALAAPEPGRDDPIARVGAGGRASLVQALPLGDLAGSLREAGRTLPGAAPAAIVPLATPAGVLGVLAGVRLAPDRSYSRPDLALFEALGRILAFSIENRRLRAVDRAVRRVADRAAGRADRLQAVIAELAGALTPERVAEIVVDQGVAALGAVAGAIAVYSAEDRRLSVIRAVGYPAELLEAWRGFPVDGPIPMADAFRTGEAIWLESPADWAARYPDLAARHETAGRGAWAAVPLTAGPSPVGVIGLSFAAERTFNEEARKFVQALAQHCALGLERAHLYEAARAATRARDEFLMVAAHELKTPITNLRGYTQFLVRRLRQDGRLDPEQLRQTLQVLEDQSSKLTRLVTRLLDVSQIDAGRLTLALQPADLAALVDQVIAVRQPFAPDHPLRLRAAGNVRARVDPFRIEQVLVNLIDNAVRYSPASASIEIEIDRPDPATVRLAVRDHGVGIPPEKRRGIFDRFYQGHAGTYFAGLGLGLSICRQIVELHGGRIEAEFPEDGGTRFVVSLPADDPE